MAEWGSGGPNRSLNYLHPLADVAEREFSWVLTNGLDKTIKNQAMESACKRAAQIHREMVLPLREDPTVSVKAMQAHMKQHVDRLKKLTNASNLAAVLESGAGETLAAAIVLVCSTDTSRLLEPCLKTGQTLEACRVELQRLAGK
ncbi:MAG: hypothetical protein ACI90M_003876 [Candidatus Azotimanducaceae bacterium]